MFCTNCGKEINDDSLFCTNCGSKQEIIAAETIAEEPKNNEELTSEESVQPTSANEALDVEKSVPPVVEVSPEPEPVAVASAVETNTVQQDESIIKPNISETKKSSSVIVVGVVVVAVIAGLLLLFGGGSGFKNEKDLAKAYFQAICKEDFNTLLKCYDKDDQKDLKEDKEDIKEKLEEMKEALEDVAGKNAYKEIKDVDKSKLSSKRGVTYYNLTVEFEDGNQYLTIKKEKNKFYIEAKSDAF